MPWWTETRDIKKAFDLWSGVTNRKFIYKASGGIDIYISLVTYDHGDVDPFDGRGVTLAHTPIMEMFTWMILKIGLLIHMVVQTFWRPSHMKLVTVLDFPTPSPKSCYGSVLHFL